MSFADGAFEGGPARVSRASASLAIAPMRSPFLAQRAPALFAGDVERCAQTSAAVLLGLGGAAAAARREGLSDRRQGHRRHDDAARSRPRRARATSAATNIVGKRSLFTENARANRPPQFVGLAVAMGDAPCRPARMRVETSGGRRRSHRLRDVKLFQPDARTADRARTDRARSVRASARRSNSSISTTTCATISNACALDPEGARLHV